MNPIPFFFGTFCLMAGLAPATSIPADGFFKVDTIAEGLSDPMEITILPNQDVLIAERTGALKRFSKESGEVKTLKKFDVSVIHDGESRETGLLGVTADPKFSENGWIYVYFSPSEAEEHRLARLTLKEGKIGDEKILLKIPQSRKNGVCHEGGSLAFGPDGNLFISTGDNTNPFPSRGYPPMDEREGNEHMNSFRSAANTNDLRGKILRIRPTDEGGYEIPEGNLFPKGTEGTKPEIFAMGCRNPWRIGVDQRTGAVYWGDVGPDARGDTPRGPSGYGELNRAPTAGNYGWPLFIADNQAYALFDYATGDAGEKFVAGKPVNPSRLNTGLKSLPAARPPLWYEPRSCYCSGPVYYSGDYPENPGKLPADLDGCLISYDWNNGRMQLTKLTDDGGMEWKEDWLISKKFVHPSDVELGPDGSMYVLEYGSAWYDGSDGKLMKVSYSTTEIASEVEGPDARLAGLNMKHPGASLLADATCLSCHQTQVKSVGPRYVDVADLYRGKPGAEEKLAEKILKGGVGVWGEVPMPPHPQYNAEQVSQMVDAILSLEPDGHKE